MSHKLLGCLLMAAACIARGETNAANTLAGDNDDCKRASAQCVTIGRWNFSVSLGVGARSNPLVDGKIIPLVIIPHLSYYGKRFFLDDLDLGFTLLEDKFYTLSLVASPGYDRVYFYRSDLQNFFVDPVAMTVAARPANAALMDPGTAQLPERKITYLAGPEWTFSRFGVDGQLDVLRDATGQNSGTEVRAALGLPLVRSTGSLTANIGVTWKSAAIVNYYYGVPEIYRAGAALDPFLKLGYTLPLSGKWSFNTFVDYEKLGAAIADSPLVARSYVVTGFVGATYAF